MFKWIGYFLALIHLPKAKKTFEIIIIMVKLKIRSIDFIF